MLGMLASDHSPDLFLDEIQDQLQCVHGLEISLMTISCTLKRLGMTSKQASRLDTIETHLTVPSFISLQPKDAKTPAVNFL
jgi:hypothetical protein